jgi:hypothetical protein
MIDTEYQSLRNSTNFNDIYQNNRNCLSNQYRFMFLPTEHSVEIFFNFIKLYLI